MKRLLIAISLLLAVIPLWADDQSAALLRKMTAAFSTARAYQIDFTASMPGEFTGIPGTFIVSGTKYFLDVYESQISFDGATVYNYSEDNDEVILEKPDLNDNSLFANPSRIFQLYDKDFNHAFKGTGTANGKPISIIELTPKMPGSGYTTITLKVDSSTGLPVSIAYDMVGYGGKMELSILRVNLNASVTDNQFVFDPSKHPGVEVIDFR